MLSFRIPQINCHYVLTLYYIVITLKEENINGEMNMGVLQVRVDDELKNQANAIFEEMPRSLLLDFCSSLPDIPVLPQFLLEMVPFVFRLAVRYANQHPSALGIRESANPLEIFLPPGPLVFGVLVFLPHGHPFHK